MQKQSFFSRAVYKYTVLFPYYPPSGAVLKRMRQTVQTSRHTTKTLEFKIRGKRTRDHNKTQTKTNKGVNTDWPDCNSPKKWNHNAGKFLFALIIPFATDFSLTQPTM